ncbi:MAG: glycosyltransferase family 4 protein, partial [Microcystaceae cyanobacterium]
KNGYRVDLLVYGLANLGEQAVNDLQSFLKPLGIAQIWWQQAELISTGDRPGSSWQEDWQTYQAIPLPEELNHLIESQKFDLIWLDYPLLFAGLRNTALPIIAEVNNLVSYDYAQENQREIDPQELAKEIQILQQCQVLVTRSPGLAAKLEELTQKKEVYAWQEKENLHRVSAESLNDFYINQLENILSQSLGSQALPLKPEITTLKIAILYPWGDIQERRSGASQRTGLMLDYLREQSYEIRVYTIGQARQVWSEGVYYDYYEPSFAQAELVKEVYQEAYRSWVEDLALVNASHFDSLTDFTEHWLPWIYYQFRFYPNFQAWLNQITDWADVVILEYPFWGYLVGPICRKKSVKLLITAHDVLAKNLSLDTALGQIALGEELKALKQADEVITLTPDDQEFFVNYGISSHCVPIAIDTQKIEMTWQNPPMTISLELWHSQRDLNRPFCLFVGSQHPPNVEAVKQIQAWSQRPNLPFDFVVVGSCWPLEWQKQFFALGKVSETDLIYLYHHAALVIAPLSQGTGMSVKTLEAMAYGKALLGTAIAFRGYPIQSGVHALVENQLDRYSDQISDLLQQPERLQAISQQAKEFAKNYDYRTLYRTYEKLLRP